MPIPPRRGLPAPRRNNRKSRVYHLSSLEGSTDYSTDYTRQFTKLWGMKKLRVIAKGLDPRIAYVPPFKVYTSGSQYRDSHARGGERLFVRTDEGRRQYVDYQWAHMPRATDLREESAHPVERHPSIRENPPRGKPPRYVVRGVNEWFPLAIGDFPEPRKAIQHLLSEAQTARAGGMRKHRDKAVALLYPTRRFENLAFDGSISWNRGDSDNPRYQITFSHYGVRHEDNFLATSADGQNWSSRFERRDVNTHKTVAVETPKTIIEAFNHAKQVFWTSTAKKQIKPTSNREYRLLFLTWKDQPARLELYSLEEFRNTRPTPPKKQ